MMLLYASACFTVVVQHSHKLRMWPLIFHTNPKLCTISYYLSHLIWCVSNQGCPKIILCLPRQNEDYIVFLLEPQFEGLPMWTESHQGNSLRCFHCAKCACCTSHPISRPLHCEMFRHSRFKATTKVGIWCDMTNKQSDRVNTSSTAQGGGGSFENRKTIGEVGCCESGIAERCHWWIERCLISLTLSLPFSDYLPTYLSIFHVSIYLSLSLSLSFICLSV